MEEKGRNFQPEGQEGGKVTCGDRGPRRKRVYGEEGNEFRLGKPECLNIKLRKDQSPSNQISNELTGVTHLYPILSRSHERKARRVGEKKLCLRSFPERYAFALSSKYKNPFRYEVEDSTESQLARPSLPTHRHRASHTISCGVP